MLATCKNLVAEEPLWQIPVERLPVVGFVVYKEAGAALQMCGVHALIDVRKRDTVRVVPVEEQLLLNGAEISRR